MIEQYTKIGIIQTTTTTKIIYLAFIIYIAPTIRITTESKDPTN